MMPRGDQGMDGDADGVGIRDAIKGSRDQEIKRSMAGRRTSTKECNAEWDEHESNHKHHRG
jgi:hypothetical protein